MSATSMLSQSDSKYICTFGYLACMLSSLDFLSFSVSDDLTASFARIIISLLPIGIIVFISVCFSYSSSFSRINPSSSMWYSSGCLLKLYSIAALFISRTPSIHRMDCLLCIVFLPSCIPMEVQAIDPTPTSQTLFVSFCVFALFSSPVCDRLRVSDLSDMSQPTPLSLAHAVFAYIRSHVFHLFFGSVPSLASVFWYTHWVTACS